MALCQFFFTGAAEECTGGCGVREFLKKIVSGREKSVGENQAFIRLMQVAREDREVRDRLVAILSLDPFNRRSALNTYLEQLRLKEAPAEFISALSCFLDDGVARKAMELLGGSSAGKIP